MQCYNKKYPNNKLLKQAHRSFPDNMPMSWNVYKLIKNKLFTIRLEMPENSKVLDIGCNSGEIGVMLKEKNNCDVYGIDINKDLVKKAKSKGIKAVYGDAERLPFKKDSFDCVFLGEIIEHSYNPDKILKEAFRVLKPGGKLVGTTVDEKEKQVDWDDDRLHATKYNRTDINRLISKCFVNTRAYWCYDYERESDLKIIWIIFTGYKNEKRDITVN